MVRALAAIGELLFTDLYLDKQLALQYKLATALSTQLSSIDCFSLFLFFFISFFFLFISFQFISFSFQDFFNEASNVLYSGIALYIIRDTVCFTFIFYRVLPRSTAIQM